MNLLEAYQKLDVLKPLFTSKEAADSLGVSRNYASAILSRLEKKKTVIHLTRGRWAYSPDIDPLLLPSLLVQPMAAYVSLYSALYYHGMIEQIPSVVFAVTNGKTNLIETPIATVSLHSINPALFSGYEVFGKHDVLMATAEKALFDSLYFMPAKSHSFRRLTELELPDDFDTECIDSWVEKIDNKSRREMMYGLLSSVLPRQFKH